MGILEVVLLLVGAVLAVLSFVLPAAKEEAARETKVLAKEEIKSMVDSEMKDIRHHVDDVVDEAVGYAVEKTERSLERLTNEKIMAVNEYSDTVLQEINKNHEEAMFLYDMLNTKHETLKDTVSEANKAVLDMQEKLDGIVANSVLNQMPVTADSVETYTGIENIPSADKSVSEPEFKKLDLSMIPKETAKTSKKSSAKKESLDESEIKLEVSEQEPVKEWDFLADVKDAANNHNDEILAMHEQGKSTVAIARALGLGVGEVKLVIDLYKNL